jgi:hypothetical protein
LLPLPLPTSPPHTLSSLFSFAPHIHPCSFPLLFHSLIGKDEQEGNSPSWFNQLEAKQVLHYIRELMQLRRNRLTADQIGVITPYNKQVQKLRTLLKKDYEGVEVRENIRRIH